MDLSFTIAIFVLIILAIVILSILGRFVSLWFQAIVSGTPISLFNIIGMSLRKILLVSLSQLISMPIKQGLSLFLLQNLKRTFWQEETFLMSFELSLSQIKRISLLFGDKLLPLTLQEEIF